MSTIPQNVPQDASRKAFLDGEYMGEVRDLKIADLHIDRLYQRDLIADVVENIADNWDARACGAILVVERENGELFIVDGQHRTAGAVRAGKTHIRAQVVQGLSPDLEARLRLKGNYKRTDRIYEVFRARVFANDPVALLMKSTVEEFDSKINFVPDMAQGLNSIGTIEALYKLDAGETLRATLGLIKGAWGELTPTTGSSSILKAVAWFLHRHGEELGYQYDRLTERLRTEGPAALGRMARNQKAAMGGALWLNTYRALVEVYNYNLRENSRLEWRTNRATRFQGALSAGGHGAWKQQANSGDR